MRLLTFGVTALFALPVLAHPVPDVPVRGEFKSEGASTIKVDVDPRCFAEDPENTPSLKKRELDRMSKDERNDLISKARTFIEKTLLFRFDPQDALRPKFKYDFVERPDAAPDSDGGTPVVIVAIWKEKLPTDLTKYQLMALEKGRFSIYFLNRIDGRDQKLNVLFPGEKSYWLDLPRARDPSDSKPENTSGAPTASDADAVRSSTFLALLRQGFVHVVPLGRRPLAT